MVWKKKPGITVFNIGREIVFKLGESEIKASSSYFESTVIKGLMDDDSDSIVLDLTLLNFQVDRDSLLEYFNVAGRRRYF